VEFVLLVILTQQDANIKNKCWTIKSKDKTNCRNETYETVGKIYLMNHRKKKRRCKSIKRTADAVGFSVSTEDKGTDF
jgi:hypothetical protein